MVILPRVHWLDKVTYNWDGHIAHDRLATIRGTSKDCKGQILKLLHVLSQVNMEPCAANSSKWPYQGKWGWSFKQTHLEPIAISISELSIFQTHCFLSLSDFRFLLRPTGTTKALVARQQSVFLFGLRFATWGRFWGIPIYTRFQDEHIQLSKKSRILYAYICCMHNDMHRHIHLYIYIHAYIHYTITFHFVTLHYITFHFSSLYFVTLHYITFNFNSLPYTIHFISMCYITFHFVTLRYISFCYITLHYISCHFVALGYITLNFVTLHCITFHFSSIYMVTLH